MQISEPLLRGGVFIVVLVAMLAMEELAPRRPRTLPRWRRWTTNGAMVVIATALVRALGAAFPALMAAGAAELAQQNRAGLLNLIAMPAGLAFAISLLAMDGAVWVQHRLTHRIDVLWRIHRVHHADADLDATTALRFHPAEILLSSVYKAAFVVFLGAPPEAVIAFEIILNACALFNHANVALPSAVENILRAVIVTPGMHQVHHSRRPEEQGTNFGFCLSIWDRMAGSFAAAPAGGEKGLVIGLQEARNSRATRLVASLTYPFRD